VKVKELSLLIVDEDQTLRQLLAAIVSDRYRSVTTAAPEEVGSLLVVESFDVMIVPRSGTNSSAGNAGDSLASGVMSVAAIGSAVTGKIYDFKSINQAASSWAMNPFECVLLQVAIENSEFALRQLKRIEEADIVY
jgi:DNA-binding NtrC family response regulator